MTILGHDVNGRPLRAGDRAVMVSCLNPRFPARVGDVVIVERLSSREMSPWTKSPETYLFCRGFGGKEFAAGSLRRVDDRTAHQPSDFAFDSLMDHLRTGVPDHA